MEPSDLHFTFYALILGLEPFYVQKQPFVFLSNYDKSEESQLYLPKIHIYVYWALGLSEHHLGPF